MSPEQLVIRNLECQFEEERITHCLKAGGPVVGRLNELLKEGVNWPAEYREKLAVLAEKIFGDRQIGWGNPGRRRERETRIQLLRRGQ